jgi:uncharacterized protein YjbI with pentapeptide repeats
MRSNDMAYRSFKAEFLNMTTDEQVAHLVKSGVPEGVSLAGFNFSGKDLRKADLMSAKLNNATLTDADLRGANLSRASLRDAKLAGAKLKGVILTDADLTNATFTNADFTNADIVDADFTGVNFSKIKFSGTYGVVSATKDIHFINGKVFYVRAGKLFGTLEAIRNAGYESYIEDFLDDLDLHDSGKRPIKYNFDRWEARSG